MFERRDLWLSQEPIEDDYIEPVFEINLRGTQDEALSFFNNINTESQLLHMVSSAGGTAFIDASSPLNLFLVYYDAQRLAYPHAKKPLKRDVDIDSTYGLDEHSIGYLGAWLKMQKKRLIKNTPSDSRGRLLTITVNNKPVDWIHVELTDAHHPEQDKLWSTGRVMVHDEETTAMKVLMWLGHNYYSCLRQPVKFVDDSPEESA